MNSISRFLGQLPAIAALILAQGVTVDSFAAEGPAELGKQLFTGAASPPCAVCHTLSDAAAEGAIGPNLDELKPDLERVKKVVRGGMGAMPPYDTLSDEEVDALGIYVSTVTTK